MAKQASFLLYGPQKSARIKARYASFLYFLCYFTYIPHPRLICSKYWYFPLLTGELFLSLSFFSVCFSFSLYIHIIHFLYVNPALLFFSFFPKNQYIPIDKVSFPGGHIDPGESEEKAAVRETIEELGSSIGDIEVIGKCQQLVAGR